MGGFFGLRRGGGGGGGQRKGLDWSWDFNYIYKYIK